MTNISKQRTFNGAELKLVAMWTMLVDHVAAVIIETTSLYQSTGFQMLAVVCRLIGRLSFPIICFLLIEGFCHTTDLKKYIIRMGVFALLSELPFDLAFFGKPDIQRQNVFFTLLTGLLLLSVLKKAETIEPSSVIRNFIMIVAVLAACELTTLGRFDYSYMGILLIAALYYFRGDRRKQCMAGSILSLYELTAVLAFLFIGRYDGKKGELKIPKNIF